MRGRKREGIRDMAERFHCHPESHCPPCEDASDPRELAVYNRGLATLCGHVLPPMCNPLTFSDAAFSSVISDVMRPDRRMASLVAVMAQSYWRQMG